MSVLRVDGSVSLGPTEAPGRLQEAAREAGNPGKPVHFPSEEQSHSPSPGTERPAIEAPFRESDDAAGRLPQEPKSVAPAACLRPSSSSAIPPSCAARPPLIAPVHKFARDADIAKLPLSCLRFRPVKPSDYTQLRQLHEELFPFKYEHTFYDFVCKGQCFSLAAVVSKQDLESLPRRLTSCAQPRPTPARHLTSSVPRCPASFSQDGGSSGVREEASAIGSFPEDSQPRSTACAALDRLTEPSTSGTRDAQEHGTHEPFSDAGCQRQPRTVASPYHVWAPDVLASSAGVSERADGETTGRRQPSPTRTSPSAGNPSDSSIHDSDPSLAPDASVSRDNGDSSLQGNSGGTSSRAGDCVSEETGGSATPGPLEKEDDDACDELLVGIITVSQKSAYFRSHDMDCVRRWYRMKRECPFGAEQAPGRESRPRTTRRKSTCCSHALGQSRQILQPSARLPGQRWAPFSAHLPPVYADSLSSNATQRGQRKLSGSGICRFGDESFEKRTRLSGSLVGVPGSGAGESSSGPRDGIEEEREESSEVSDASEAAVALNFPNLQADESVSDLAYILTLGVAEEFRQKGLAQELIQRTLAYFACPCLNKLPTRAVFLHVVEYNHAAVHFYEKQKFQAIEHSRDFYHIYGSVHGSFLYAFNLTELDSRCECSVATEAKRSRGFAAVKAFTSGNIQEGVQWGLVGVQNAFRKVGETLGNLWNSHPRGGGHEFGDCTDASYGT
ncbi:Acetyltransferase, GNAT family protein, related [Neospora caninum Liverpool]|uniref:N-alpha-acetyltransferase 60 n=1 Tax=Neospora caninum (strain Liverpool) TaxID=572307 RepID=F0VGL6_NEOCL|nr:Acetyltransferase, GNAT family protein, related [Neospora caninum Liverpool]CBZ52860.1 Acetyltransferase, GNAT family protein, related [Neospora caninum Liverpool]CEL66841.1 TPA: Acetyltransferase, GNAT family protein, related [Neospora caninum Liverpool]|eukprot:XP_003882892.1 Acetyltransferase, GNAT family protein, related [Neospora caninum Liverpool]